MDRHARMSCAEDSIPKLLKRVMHEVFQKSVLKVDDTARSPCPIEG
jgi:hypothetical protein